MTTLVCGVGGMTGDAVVAALAGRGMEVRALVHRDERREAALRLGATSVVVADYDDEARLTAAMDGVESVYFVAPVYQAAEPRWVATALRAAELAGVDRFVYHSVLHAYTPSMPHHRRKAESEVAVRASLLRWTIVQPAMYAQTVLRVRERSVDGQINVPYDPDALFSVVDVHDVAAAVAEVLADDVHAYAGYEVVGGEVQTFRDMVATMNAVLGESRDAIQVAASSLPLPTTWTAAQRDEYALMCNEYDAHGLLGSGAATAALLGRTPVTFEEVVTRDVLGRINTGAHA